MTPKPTDDRTDDRTALERAGDQAAALKNIMWLVFLIATAFGAYVHFVVHSVTRPLVLEQQALRAEVQRQNEVVEELATLQVETDSSSAAVHLRQLRELRRFSQPPR